jgi:hypothetical protein
MPLGLILQAHVSSPRNLFICKLLLRFKFQLRPPETRIVRAPDSVYPITTRQLEVTRTDCPLHKSTGKPVLNGTWA